MSNYTEDYIEDYLYKRLSPAEERQFNQALAEDAALRKRTDEVRDVVLLTDLADQNRTRNRLRNSLEKRRKAKKTKWILGSLLLIVLLGLGLLWLLSNSMVEERDTLQEQNEGATLETPDGTPDVDNAEDDLINEPLRKNEEEPIPRDPDPEKNKLKETAPKKEPAVYAANMVDLVHAAHEIPVSSDPIRGRTYEDTLTLAYNALKEATPLMAIELLEPIYQRSIDEEKVNELLAHAYLDAGNYAESAQLFQRLRANPGSLDPDEIEWNLLLAILARDKLESPASNAIFEKILSEKNHNQYLPAVKLRQDLDGR
ncbi:MAG: hypothetical protein AAF705_22025 [Bacteroidota bacterium]